MATVTAIVAASALFRSANVSSSEGRLELEPDPRFATLGNIAVNRESSISRLKAVPMPISVIVRASPVSKLIFAPPHLGFAALRILHRKSLQCHTSPMPKTYPENIA